MPPVDLLTPSLSVQICDFIRCFGVVRERQVRKFFADWGTGDVEHILHYLIANGEVVRHQEEYLSYNRKLPKPLPYYMPCMDAIDVMAMLRSQNVIWANRDDFPLEITFLTTDNNIYDVCVFDEQWLVKYTLIPRIRGQGLPLGESDPIQHVAVVPSVELAQKLSPLGFDLYAVVDRNSGHAELFSLDD